MFFFGSSHSIVTRGTRISRAPPHNTIPAFLNVNGRKIQNIIIELLKECDLNSDCSNFELQNEIK